MIKKFLLESKNIDKSAVVWNMLGSLLIAFQSVIFLMVITRILDLTEAGIFTIAYANATLLLTVGKYGMRNFQISDVNEEFYFQEYLVSRWITTGIMLILAIGYVSVLSNSETYTMHKIMIIAGMCLFKMVDSVEDVYFSLYQQRKRLDIGAKMITLRMIIVIITFTCTLIISKSQLTALAVTTIISALFAYRVVRVIQETLTIEKNIRKNKIIQLLWQCFPVFLGTFLAFYIGNAPKYAIDLLMSDEAQACYGFIAMPVFVIGMLNGFIFNPMLVRLSVLWDEGENNIFVKLIFRQVLIIVGITVSCLMGAYLIGIPVLSFLYNTNLIDYKLELLVLLCGGGLLGVSGLLSALLTIVRFQKCLTWIYGTVAGVACLSAQYVVGNYGILGASILYLVLMGLLCIGFALCLIKKIIQNK